jgi:hypothetical protein
MRQVNGFKLPPVEVKHHEEWPGRDLLLAEREGVVRLVDDLRLGGDRRAARSRRVNRGPSFTGMDSM